MNAIRPAVSSRHLAAFVHAGVLAVLEQTPLAAVRWSLHRRFTGSKSKPRAYRRAVADLIDISPSLDAAVTDATRAIDTHFKDPA